MNRQRGRNEATRKAALAEIGVADVWDVLASVHFGRTIQ